MEIAEHLELLERDGRAFATSATRARLDTSVPTCPKWSVRDLVDHLGGVYRWATFHLTTSSTAATTEEEERRIFAVDGDPLELFRASHRGLVAALRDAADDLACWSFLPAPTPRAFWSRRQALETAVHRFDAESADGATEAIDSRLALDGIDELLRGFHARSRSRLVSDPPCSLSLRATDSGDAWTVQVLEDRRVVEEGYRGADCQVSGTASDLYLFLWNRLGRDALAVSGSLHVLDVWRERSGIV